MISVSCSVLSCSAGSVVRGAHSMCTSAAVSFFSVAGPKCLPETIVKRPIACRRPSRRENSRFASASSSAFDTRKWNLCGTRRSDARPCVPLMFTFVQSLRRKVRSKEIVFRPLMPTLWFGRVSRLFSVCLRPKPSPHPVPRSPTARAETIVYRERESKPRNSTAKDNCTFRRARRMHFASLPFLQLLSAVSRLAELVFSAPLCQTLLAVNQNAENKSRKVAKTFSIPFPTGCWLRRDRDCHSQTDTDINF